MSLKGLIDMKRFTVTYIGSSRRFANLKLEINALDERSAVEDVYAMYLDENYFPGIDGEKGYIYDCDGIVIAEPDDTSIRYDGGRFFAEEIIEEF
jgi:hypothetical protein